MRCIDFARVCCYFCSVPGVARAPVLASGNLYKKPETSFNFIDWPPEEAARAKKKKLKVEPPEEDKREETQRPETQEKSGGWLWLQGKNSNLISPATAGWLRAAGCESGCGAVFL